MVEHIAVEIREVERGRPEETGFVESFEIERAAQPLDRPWAPAPDLAESRAWFTHVDESQKRVQFLAWDGDRALGLAGVDLPLTDNTDKAFCGITVHPEFRRRGVGTALTERLVAVTREHGRRELLSGLNAPPDAGPDHPSRAFARSVGFSTANVEIERQLDLPVPPKVLDRLDADAQERYLGAYTIEFFVDGVPETLLPSYCAAMNRLAVDAPTGDIDFEEESFTPQQFRSFLELGLSTGGHRIDALALTADREVAAYSAMFLSGSSPDLAWQGGTLVTAPHRGHRLGTAVKITNLRALADRCPQVERVLTDNAETNSYMVSINVALGFRIIAVKDMLQRRLG